MYGIFSAYAFTLLCKTILDDEINALIHKIDSFAPTSGTCDSFQDVITERIFYFFFKTTLQYGNFINS